MLSQKQRPNRVRLSVKEEWFTLILYLSIKCTVGILIFCHQSPAGQHKLDNFVFTASASRGSVVYWLYQTYLIKVNQNLG